MTTAFQAGDIIVRVGVPKARWRVNSAKWCAEIGRQWICVTPVRKDGQRDNRRNRIGWSGAPLPGEFEIVGKIETKGGAT